MADSDHLRLPHTDNETDQKGTTTGISLSLTSSKPPGIKSVLLQGVHVQSEMTDVINAHHVLQLKLQLYRLAIN